MHFCTNSLLLLKISTQFCQPLNNKPPSAPPALPWGGQHLSPTEGSSLLQVWLEHNLELLYVVLP